ncbi:MAG: Cof-type HAD-IIB family hydrolase [Bacteroidales bacterium]|nr:Cof-type HAD-IIB family hydrolase [Bacteroidales bacterium]
MNNNVRMVVTDMDGTLLNSNGKISEENYLTLKTLGEKNILRVFATGRSIFSAFHAIDNNSPFDYLVFSSGTGVYCRNQQKILYSRNIQACTTKKIVLMLKNFGLNFSVANKIPDNHKYCYYKYCDEPDFDTRNNKYRPFIKEIDFSNISDSPQIIVIFNKNEDRFDEISKKLFANFNDINIIKATSPISGENIWLEIYPKNTSKFTGVSFISKLHNINLSETLGVGNDFNDIDFLDKMAYPFVTQNANIELHKKYFVTKSNNENGFSEAVKKIISDINLSKLIL